MRQSEGPEEVGGRERRVLSSTSYAAAGEEAVSRAGVRTCSPVEGARETPREPSPLFPCRVGAMGIILREMTAQ